MTQPYSYANFNLSNFDTPTKWVPLIPKGDPYFQDGFMHQDHYAVEVIGKRKPFRGISSFSDSVDPSSLHNQTTWGNLSRIPDSVRKEDLEHIIDNQSVPPVQNITETTPKQPDTAPADTANQAEKKPTKRIINSRRQYFHRCCRSQYSLPNG